MPCPTPNNRAMYCGIAASTLGTAGGNTSDFFMFPHKSRAWIAACFAGKWASEANRAALIAPALVPTNMFGRWPVSSNTGRMIDRAPASYAPRAPAPAATTATRSRSLALAGPSACRLSVVSGCDVTAFVFAAMSPRFQMVSATATFMRLARAVEKRRLGEIAVSVRHVSVRHSWLASRRCLRRQRFQACPAEPPYTPDRTVCCGDNALVLVDGIRRWRGAVTGVLGPT